MHKFSSFLLRQSVNGRRLRKRECERARQAAEMAEEREVSTLRNRRERDRAWLAAMREDQRQDQVWKEEGKSNKE